MNYDNCRTFTRPDWKTTLKYPNVAIQAIKDNQKNKICPITGKVCRA